MITKSHPKQHPNLEQTYLINDSSSEASGKSPAAEFFNIYIFVLEVILFI